MSKPRKVKLLRRLRITEASLVDAGANQHSKICIWKRADPDLANPSSNAGEILARDHEEEPEMLEEVTKSAVSDNMLAVAHQRYPDAPTPEQALALAVSARDEVIQRMWGIHERAAPDPVEVAKAADDPTEASWQAIEAKARDLMLVHPTMTHAAAVARAIEMQPELYTSYRTAFDEIAADVD